MNVIADDNKSLDTSNLPSVPRVLVELLRLCHDDDADFESFAGLIEQEPGLITKVLQVANSSAFRQWNNVGDLRRMLIVLGLGNVKTIVATAAVEHFFSRLSGAVNQQVQLIWMRSVLCANFCERLARLLGYRSPGEAFLSGLLHQIGMLILLKNEEAAYLPLLEIYRDQPFDFCNKEQDILQTDHCELGALLVESWQLDSFLADAIRYQQAPCDALASAPTLLKILAVAGSFQSETRCRSIHADKGAQLLGLTTDTLQRCSDEAQTKSANMLTALGLNNAFAAIHQYNSTGSIDPDQASAEKLRDAIRYLALSRATAADFSPDLMVFSQQIRIGFASIFPVKQLLLLTYHDVKKELFVINDLNLHQLQELIWTTDDESSQVVRTFTGGKDCLLTLDNADVADRQLLRLLTAQQAHLFPLSDRTQGLGLIAVSLDDQRSDLNHETLILLRLLCADIGRRFAAVKNALNRAHISPTDFRKLIHEVSNPLSIINNYLYILGKKLDADNSAQTELNTIREEIDRVGRILLHAKQPQDSQYDTPCPVDINKLITDLHQLFSGSLYQSDQIQFDLRLDKNMPQLLCSADKLKQILINLSKNAVEALNDGGTIVIITRDGIFQNQQRFIEITVKDNGPGINPQILPQLFQPAASTKPGHSGLGLAVVHTLIKELGGSLSCSSAPERGTEFTLLLPRVTAEQQGGNKDTDPLT